MDHDVFFCRDGEVKLTGGLIAWSSFLGDIT